MGFCKPSVAVNKLFVAKGNKCNLPGRKGEDFASTDGVCEPRDCLSRFAEQLHLHDVCTFLVQKSAYADCSRYALPKYLGLIQGNDLDCCRWVIDPSRGAGGVREFSNYGSLRLVREGCSQHSESGCFSRTPFQRPPDEGEVNRDVGLPFQPSGVTFCC